MVIFCHVFIVQNEVETTIFDPSGHLQISSQFSSSGNLSKIDGISTPFTELQRRFPTKTFAPQRCAQHRGMIVSTASAPLEVDSAHPSVPTRLPELVAGKYAELGRSRHSFIKKLIVSQQIWFF